MTSNTRLSILKPGKPREPLQDLSQLLPTNDEEETTTTDNHKRRVSFACVNKVKEFESGAECTTLHQTPAYDERFSMSSDSYQSSISEYHNKSTFLTFGDTSKLLSRGKGNAENIDIVELGLHNVSRGAPSPGKMSAREASMDITSVIMRNEDEYVHNVSRAAPSPGKMSAGEASMDITSVIMRNEDEYADFESTYYPLNLTKSRPSTQIVNKFENNDDKDILDSSSMETTEALPCLMTETIVTDFKSFNEATDASDISVVDMEIDDEGNSRSSMLPEKGFHIRESTALVTEKDSRFSVDARSGIRNSTSTSNLDIDAEISQEIKMTRRDITDVEMGIDEEKNNRPSMAPEKVLHVRESTTFVIKKDIQFSVEEFGRKKRSSVRPNIETDLECYQENELIPKDVSDVGMRINEIKNSRPSMAPEKVLHVRKSITSVPEKCIRFSDDTFDGIENSSKKPNTEIESEISQENDIIRKDLSDVEMGIDEENNSRPSMAPEKVLHVRKSITSVQEKCIQFSDDIFDGVENSPKNPSTENQSEITRKNEIRKDLSDVSMGMCKEKSDRPSMAPKKVLHRESITSVQEKCIQFSDDIFGGAENSPKNPSTENESEITPENEIRKDLSDVSMEMDKEKSNRPSMALEKVLHRESITSVQEKDIQLSGDTVESVENSHKKLNTKIGSKISHENEIIRKDVSVIEMGIDEEMNDRPSTVPENVLGAKNLAPERDIQLPINAFDNYKNLPESPNAEGNLEISQKNEIVLEDVSDVEMKIDEEKNCPLSTVLEKIPRIYENPTLFPEKDIHLSINALHDIENSPRKSHPEINSKISQKSEIFRKDVSVVEMEINVEKNIRSIVMTENISHACESTNSVPKRDIQSSVDAFDDIENSPKSLNPEIDSNNSQENEVIQKDVSVVEMKTVEKKNSRTFTMPEKDFGMRESKISVSEKDTQLFVDVFGGIENSSKRRSTEMDPEIAQKSKMFRKDVSVRNVGDDEEKNHSSSSLPEKVSDIRETTTSVSERNIQFADDTFGDIKNSPTETNTVSESEMYHKNEEIRNEIEKTVQSGGVPYWSVVSMTNSNWDFEALWGRLHLLITLPKHETKYSSKLSFVKKGSGIGDEILKIAIAPIIRKYRKKMDELCGRVEDVIIFMKMTIPHIKFAKNFADDFSEIVEYEGISLNNGFASFAVAHFERDFNKNILSTITVDMRNIEEFSDSSIAVKQKVGNLDEVLVRKIFFRARGDFDFFSKFVKELNRELKN